MKRTQIATGVYRCANGSFWVRPNIDGRRTWRKLAAKAPRAAIQEAAALATDYGRSKVGLTKNPYVQGIVTCEKIFEAYLAARCPNKKLEPRGEAFVKGETARIKFLRPFFKARNAETLRLSVCVEYHTWRTARISAHRTEDGGRAVELEMVTMSNALNYGVALNLIPANMLRSGRPKFVSEAQVRHCRDVAPASGDVIHKLADYMFNAKKTEVFGWQLLFEAFTGCRTIEILRLRMDAATQDQAGYSDGQYLWLSRAKGGVNPYSIIGPEFARMMECHANWHAERYPNCPWYFPGRFGDAVVGKALTKSLERACERLGIPKVTSHGLRSFYVTLRRSHSVCDAQIAAEIGDRTTDLISSTYGDIPPNWRGPGGKPLSWLPSEGLPSWMRWLSDEKKIVNL